MRYRVICNPSARRSGAAAKRRRIERAFDTLGLRYECVDTQRGDSAATLAAGARAAGFDAVVAAGGDGTVSELVNGLMREAGDGDPLPLGIVPVGTGNDLAHMAGVPRQIEAAVRQIAAGHERRIDVCRVNDRWFDNNAAIGMEPMVTIESHRIRWLAGNARYAVAVIRALCRLKAWDMRVRWDGGAYEGPAYLLSVCNSPRTGGLFRMAPRASLSDGLLDVVLVRQVSRFEVVRILSRLLTGAHVRHPAVGYYQTTRLEVECRPGTPLHADGEVIGESVRELVFTIAPARLRLLGAVGGERSVSSARG